MINLVTLQENLENLGQNIPKETLLFDLLTIYGLPKSTISLLSKNPTKLSGKDDQIILKNKVLFQTTTLEEDEHVAIDALQKDKTSYKFNPRFIIVTDFETFLAIDTKTKETLDIQIKDLGRHYAFFLPWCGMEKSQHVNENPADIRAAYKMDKLYQAIVSDNPEYYRTHSHDLNIFLSRLLFCFFAEDTGIFQKEGVFTNLIDSQSTENGEGLRELFTTFFTILNTEDSKRSGFASHFLDFPYVNGGLFETEVNLPIFTVNSRKMIIESGKLDWSSINPDIFGSMIQAVVHPGQRENLGMHYTSVPNIMKVIEPLFLNDLYAELEKSKGDFNKLTKLRERVSKIKIFDPACGSGNFLIISYKELCKLEIEIIKRQNEIGPGAISYSGVSLNSFYGIEIDDFAHEVARLSLWLTQHQMNQYFDGMFGIMKATLPLKESGKIVYANATRVDWNKVCPTNDEFGGKYEVYLVGNPPYQGSGKQTLEQKKDMDYVFVDVNDYKKLDYIACWFYLARQYSIGKNVKFAFVSTNSICQGEQVSILWPYVLETNMEIFFAVQSFKWKNLAKGNAGVSVIIVGLRNVLSGKKYLYSHTSRKETQNINAYLTEGGNVIIRGERKSISKLPEMIRGSQPSDNGHLILSEEERTKVLASNQNASKFIKKYLGNKDFMTSNKRYCIWVADNSVDLAYEIEDFRIRFDKVKKFRLSSKKKATIKKANTPYLFDETNYREINSIVVPETGSEKREYLPVDFVDKDTVLSNSLRIIYSENPYIFALLASKMHMTWVKAVAGRMKTDMRYSNTICYNTFPFPEITLNQKETLTSHVYNILEEREKYPEKTMADLYDPDKMPDGLQEAHKYLDLAIDQIYRSKPFESDEERLAHLFKLYEEMITNEAKK